VTFHGPLREHQGMRHLPVGESLRDEFGHLAFPGGQRVLSARLRGGTGDFPNLVVSRPASLGPRAPFFAGTVAAIAALAVVVGSARTRPQPGRRS
jgi:hypothetical protein